MNSEKRRARLLQQVTRLREIEHRAAAAAASMALSEAARSRQLARRAAALVEGYADLSEVGNVHELAGRRFAETRMRHIAAQTDAQADTAAAIAESRVSAEQQARRKREAIDEARTRLMLEAAKAAAGRNTEGAGLARFLKHTPQDQRGT